MSYVRGNCGRKTPYEKKHSRKGKEQEEWILEKTALDSRSAQVSDINAILEQFEARSEEGRKCALRNLIRTARNLECSIDDLGANQKLLVQFLVQSIHGSPEEALLAFDAIDILAVVYGCDEDFLKGLLDPVKAMALSASPASLEEEQQAVVGAAMRSLGVLCFFCCDNDDMIVDIVHDIDGVITVEPKNSSQPVVAAAIGAWELIHTTTDFSNEYHQRMIGSIWKHLKSSKATADTRVAAGRAIAFCFNRKADEGDTVDILREVLPDVDQLCDIIAQCASGAAHSKADRAKEQPIFKILSDWMVEGGDLPAEAVTINDSKVYFESWIILTRLATVRRIVGSGFLPQLTNNPLVSDVLQYDVPDKETRKRKLQAEKKYRRYREKIADKERTQKMSKERTTSYFGED